MASARGQIERRLDTLTAEQRQVRQEEMENLIAENLRRIDLYNSTSLDVRQTWRRPQTL
jgi:hypothetical protein